MLLKSAEFYISECKKLMKKSKTAKTNEEKIKALNDLNNLKNKISFEIDQINKIIEREDY